MNPTQTPSKIAISVFDIDQARQRDPEVFETALLTYRMIRTVGVSIASEEAGELSVLAGHIYDMMSRQDDPRYTPEDYADAILYCAIAKYDLKHLNELPKEDFDALLEEAVTRYRVSGIVRPDVEQPDDSSPTEEVEI